MEGVSMMVNKRRKKGQQVQNHVEHFVQDDSGLNQDELYNEKEEEVNVIQANEEVRIEIDENVEETQEEVNSSREHVIDIPELIVPKAKAPMPRPPPPYPQKLTKKNSENQFKKFIDMMKSLSINVPLVEELEKMPGYEKFMKDFVTKKRSMNCETIKMTHQVSAIVHSMAPKLEDHSAFTIPCTIGSADFAKALCDLGATKTHIYEATNGGLYYKETIGIIDDVLVRVDKFILPAGFVILDCEVDYEVPIILGRPFFAMGKALVDVESGELTFRVGNEKVVFHVCKSMRQPNSNEVCSFVNLVTEMIIDDTSAVMNVDDTLQAVLLNHDDDKKEGYVEYVNALQGMGSLVGQALYCFLDGYFGYNQILIAPKDQEKTTFTCRYGTFTFSRMLFGLCNAPTTFQQCMMEILTDMVDDFLEVSMDDFSVVGNSFDDCLNNLDKVLARCEETNLGVRSFLGHAGFYRRFIKEFSKVVNPLCKILEKDAKFHFNEDCMKAFELLKFKLTTTPIIITLDWSFPFELMCDTSDVAVEQCWGNVSKKSSIRPTMLVRP
ncbi:uncharacterized protein [Nicotiana tomentosiformis]|uniref:uncharacterized protein n=1 Tax=Nicotiana tomentosiformis TaxID=4098 RepID=UPI00388CB534